jgi:sugar lactone lactonase YvrE
MGSIVSSDDLRPGRSAGQGFFDAIFGRKPAQGMVSPIAVAVGPGGRVFVADPGVRGVHVFDLETRAYEIWRPPAEVSPFTQPVGLAALEGGGLLVSDSADAALFVFDEAGGFVGTVGDGLLQRPVGVAVDETGGRVFVADAAAHLVVVLALDGEEITRFGGRGTGPGEFNFPTHLALGADGSVFVADTLNFRVQAFAPDLSPRLSIGSKGDLPGYFAQPKGIAVDAAGRVFVVDAHFEAVQIFDSGGALLMAFGREGSGPGEFWLPAGVNIDKRGWIWIADSYNRRVQAFAYVGPDEDGQPAQPEADPGDAR